MLGLSVALIVAQLADMVWPREDSRAATPASVVFATALAFLLALYPNGRFVPRWTAIAAGVATLLFAASAVAGPDVSARALWPLPIAVVLVALAVGGQGYRYMRRSSADEREAVRWPLLGVLVLLTVVVPADGVSIALTGSPLTAGPVLAAVVQVAYLLARGGLRGGSVRAAHRACRQAPRDLGRRRRRRRGPRRRLRTRPLRRAPVARRPVARVDRRRGGGSRRPADPAAGSTRREDPRLPRACGHALRGRDAQRQARRDARHRRHPRRDRRGRRRRDRVRGRHPPPLGSAEPVGACRAGTGVGRRPVAHDRHAPGASPRDDGCGAPPGGVGARLGGPPHRGGHGRRGCACPARGATRVGVPGAHRSRASGPRPGIVRGLPNAAIAERLGVSSKTVANYVSIVLTKLRVPDKERAAELARRRAAELG